MTKHILIVESRGELPEIYIAKNMGWKVTFLTQDIGFYLNNKTIEETPLKYADHIIESTTNNEESVIEFVKSYNQRRSLDVVISFSEFYVNQATAAAASIGLRTMNPSFTKRARNKFITRKICQDYGIPSPMFSKVVNIEEALLYAEEIGYPCILKPIDGANSVGVQYIESPSKMLDAFNEFKKENYFGRGLYGNNEYLIEEYIAGDVFSLETVTWEGQTHVLGITDRVMTGFPFFIETGATFPVNVPKQESVVEEVLRCLIVLGIDFGACHTEFILNEQGMSIVEVNPRLGGGPVPDMIYHSTGINIIEEILKLHAGLTPNILPSINKTTTARFYCAELDGTFVSVEGYEQVVHQEDVKYFEIFKIGQRVHSPKSNFDWISKLIVVGENEADVNKRLEEIEQTFRFNIKPLRSTNG